MFTIYYADVRDTPHNCYYPHAAKVEDEESLKEAIAHDYVCAQYKGSYRSGENFIGADCLPVDCDNDHSDKEGDWVTPEDVADAFPSVTFAVHFSRHHMKEKGSRSARPRFHVLFAIERMTDAAAYAQLKQRVNEIFPYFDTKALDAARFFFGTQDAKIKLHPGTMNLSQFLLQEEFDKDLPDPHAVTEGSRNNHMSLYAGKILKRFGATTDTWEMFQEEAEKCDPLLPDEELRAIWRSAISFWKKVRAQEGYVAPAEYNKEPDWEVPIPLDEYALPTFPVDALPPAIAGYVLAVSESTQTPPDMAATCAIAVTSVCMQGKYKVAAKADWVEPVNTYILNVMNPSERKSAVETAMTRPVNAYETEQNRKNAGLIEASRMARGVLERKQKAVIEQAAKGKATDEDIKQIAEEVAAFREVRPLKLYVDDITTEKLTSVLAENNGRAAILSTEGGIFDTLAGAYSKSVNIDVMLKGYSGDSIRVDRIGRSSESILNPTLTVLLMVQPAVLSGLIKNPTFRGRGLTARFLYCIPTSSVGGRRYRSRPVPWEIYRDYDACILNMLEDDVGADPEIITLSPEADELIAAFAGELEPKLKKEYAEISDWAGKLVGNIIRISALLCRSGRMVDHGLLAPKEPLVVGEAEMESAIRIGRYFTQHAIVAFQMMSADPVMDQCRMVLRHLEEKQLGEFTRRDIMRICRSFKSAEEVQVVLNRLMDYGYLAEKEADKPSGKGRPPALRYVVNPLIHIS